MKEEDLIKSNLRYKSRFMQCDDCKKDICEIRIYEMDKLTKSGRKKYQIAKVTMDGKRICKEKHNLIYACERICVQCAEKRRLLWSSSASLLENDL